MIAYEISTKYYRRSIHTIAFLAHNRNISFVLNYLIYLHYSSMRPQIEPLFGCVKPSTIFANPRVRVMLMKLNLNEFLCAVSNTLDIIEIELFGIPTNHSKRIAYISIKIAKQLHLSDEQVFDLASLAILHDNGASLKMLHDQLIGTTKEKINLMEARKEHCIIGDDNLVAFPFFTKPQHVILYHHEKYDGSGFFGLKQDEIPLMSQIIALADTLDLSFDLRNAYERKEDIQVFVLSHKGTYFAPQLCDIFISISSGRTFWNDLSDGAIDDGIDRMIPDLHVDFSFDEIRTITKTFPRIIDAKSTFTQEHSQGLSDKIATMARYYHLDADLTQKLIIAADQHDLGKLAVSNQILDKPGKLTASEYELIKIIRA